MNVSLRSKIILIVLFVAFGVASRFLPHTFNFTPITAIALFASAYLGLRYSLITLIGIMLISDIFIGFYQWQMMIAVYGSFALSAVLGTFIKKQSVKNIAVSTMGSSLVFYVITNWAVWQFGTMYERSFSGLMQSYLMAIPFFKNSLAGDIFYTGILFGTIYAITVYKSRMAQKVRAITMGEKLWVEPST
ncbi:MAG TPA: DUF6580 family putative transport protein [Candidatus Paceibacterota bacterium]